MANIGTHFLIIVGLATIVAMAFSAFWYSPGVFGKRWMKLTGVGADCAKDGSKMMLVTFCASLTIAITLFMLTLWTGVASAKAGLLLGLWIGIGITGMSILIPAVWEGRSPRLYFITAGNLVINVLLMSMIIGHLSGKFFTY